MLLKLSIFNLIIINTCAWSPVFSVSLESLQMTELPAGVPVVVVVEMGGDLVQEPVDLRRGKVLWKPARGGPVEIVCDGSRSVRLKKKLDLVILILTTSNDIIVGNDRERFVICDWIKICWEKF